MAENYLELAREAFEASTSYIDANYREERDYSLKAFRNEHAPGSKYLSEEYKARSRIFHPKTRSIIRKNEAAGAIALFSNMEIVDVSPENPDDPTNVASAACLKELIEYRLSRTIPAFPLVMGAIQDAQTTGTVCSYQYWEYQVGEDGTKIKDKPCVQLRPIENIRLDAGSDWMDPVQSSPYFCDIVPMYVCDVRAMMTTEDPKTGAAKWKNFKDDVILRARPDVIDSTRQARLGKQFDPERESTGIKAFDIVWVLRWFMRNSQGEDQCFYTLGTEELLTPAKPLQEVYFHGRRPYALGYAILETHKALKTSMPTLVKPLQQAVNTLGNQRFDNVQFVLNKRRYVARGRQVDVQSLVRNVPGGVTMVSDPNTDVREENWADVTSSSYVEHDRLNSELDDLAGNFSPATKVANNAVNDTLGGSRIATQSAGIMSDYLLRTIIETWWEPCLRQLTLLEQYYETDEVVLGVCERKAKLFQRYGISRLTDAMLLQGVNVRVNVGMGASNPGERFQRFIIATKAAIELVHTAPPGFNVIEGVKEIYSNAGYRDGSRFMSDQQDPRLLKAMQMVQQLQQALKGKGLELQAQQQLKAMDIAAASSQSQAQLAMDDKRISLDMTLRNRELDIAQAKNQADALLKHAEIAKPEPQPVAEPVDPDMRQVELAEKLAGIDLKTAQAEKARKEAEIGEQTAAVQNEKVRADTVAAMAPVVEGNEVREQLQQVAAAVASLGTVNGEMHARLTDMNKGLGALAGVVLQPKKSVKSIRMVKNGGKTSAVVVQYDDGTTQEMGVN